MGLAQYRKKRDFRRTPEPSGGRKGRPRGRLFVVQKHDATRLHYDFRLELGGTLKSWAVPKGPSLDWKERRLAVEVEDHPVEYGDFEGIIPEGEYGGGTVLLWDHGRWFPLGDPVEGLREGKLKFLLEGKKLKGGWTLVRLREGRDSGEKKNWLLIKEKNDEHVRPSSEGDILEEKPRSVKSGLTIEEIAARAGAVWHSKERAGARKGPAGKAGRRRRDLSRLPGARKGALPGWIEPELATLAAEAPDGDRWLHELKYDGYRLIMRIEGGKARLFTRRRQDWTGRFTSLATLAPRLPVEESIIDGEVVALGDDGASSFQALQTSLSEGRDRDLVYYAFDLLHLDGYDLTGTPIEKRKEVLAEVLDGSRGTGSTIRYSDHVLGSGPEFRRQACRYAVEGVVSKLLGRPYRPGRSRDWLKSKCLKRQEFVIVGYSEPSGSRQGIGALVLAARQPGKGLVHAGRVGTGFSEKTLRDLHRRLRALERPSPPLEDPPRGPAGRKVHWVEPQLVAEVQYSDLTRDGMLRHPSFQGLREDKPAEEVVLEKESGDGKDAASAPPAGGVEVAGVRLTHPERVLYPENGLRKQDLAGYYAAVAEWMLPHLRGRPLTLVRCPQGQGKPCFFQKHESSSGAPPALRRVPIQESPIREGTGKEAVYLAVEDLAGLISLVQMGILEIHVWGSRRDLLEKPDRLVFDLDPDPAVPWKAVIETALRIRKRLEGSGLRTYVKTTGGKGLHVVAPIQRRHGWEEVKRFTRTVAEEMVREDPSRYIAVASKAKRAGKIFIDYLRNSRGATWIAPYSTRARPRAPVSTPIEWEELASGIPSDHFTVLNLPRRLASLPADPWADLDRAARPLPV